MLNVFLAAALALAAGTPTSDADRLAQEAQRRYGAMKLRVSGPKGRVLLDDPQDLAVVRLALLKKDLRREAVARDANGFAARVSAEIALRRPLLAQLVVTTLAGDETVETLVRDARPCDVKAGETRRAAARDLAATACVDVSVPLGDGSPAQQVEVRYVALDAGSGEPWASLRDELETELAVRAFLAAPAAPAPRMPAVKNPVAGATP